MIKLIFFDMDGVLTVEKSSWFYVNNSLGINNRENYLKYISGKLDYYDFFRMDIAAWLEKYPGITMEEIKGILDEIPVSPGIENCMAYLKKNNIISVIVSGGISWLSDRLKNSFGIDEAYANRIFSSRDGKLIPDGEVQVNPMRKDIIMRKIMAEHNLSPGECIALGDSESDYSMYKAVNNFIAFNSDSNILSSVARVNLTGNIDSIINYIND